MRTDEQALSVLDVASFLRRHQVLTNHPQAKGPSNWQDALTGLFYRFSDSLREEQKGASGASVN